MRRITSMLAVGVVTVGASVAPMAEPQELLSLSGDVAGVHDPSVIKEGNTYYVFCTDGRAGEGVIPIRTSTDLRTWTSSGHVFSALPEWATREIPQARNAWAPDVSRFNDKFHLYYSVSSFSFLNTATAGVSGVHSPRAVRATPCRPPSGCAATLAAIELAVGAPMVVGATHSRRPRTFEIDEPTPEELRKIGADEDARDKLIEEASISKNAMSIMLKAHEWFRAHEATVRNDADAVLLEAIAIAHWDSCFIGAKLHRALHGRDRHESGDDWDADPIQNDWNGSAKIALISIERSESAWQTIAQATGDVVAAELAAAVAALRREVEEAFPFARLFTRPGFDDPHC